MGQEAWGGVGAGVAVLPWAAAWAGGPPMDTEHSGCTKNIIKNVNKQKKFVLKISVDFRSPVYFIIQSYFPIFYF